MKVAHLSLALLLLTAVHASTYDYYVFASEWAGSVCTQFACTQASGISSTWFNIHGLWPSQNANPLLPANCTNEPFNPALLSSQTKSDLVTYWSGLYSSADAFHAHEWSKHGTCWNDNIGKNHQEDYFSTVIKVAHKVNVFSVLSKAGITPRAVPYPLIQIQQALQKVYGKTTISCSGAYIVEVRVCLDLNYNYINCPGNSTSNCPVTVNYPPLKLQGQHYAEIVIFDDETIDESSEDLFD